jgi:hypothetical protein
MSDREQQIWDALKSDSPDFLSPNPHFSRYDAVSLGEHRRADGVIEIPEENTVWVCEVKYKIDTTALGQAILYATLSESVFLSDESYWDDLKPLIVYETVDTHADVVKAAESWEVKKYSVTR